MIFSTIHRFTWLLVLPVLISSCFSFTSPEQGNKELIHTSLSLDRPVWSHDNKFLAVSGFNSETGISQMFVLDPNTLQQTKFFEAPSASVQDWSSNASNLLISSDGKIFLLQKDNPNNAEFLTTGTVAAWSPDEKLIAVADQEIDRKVLKLLDPEKRSEQILPDQTNATLSNIFDIAWSQDGTKLLFSATDENNKLNADIFLFDFTNQKYDNLTNGTEGLQFTNPVWLSSDKILYLQTNINNYDAFLVLRTLSTGCVEKLPRNSVSSIALSPDQSSLAYVLKNSRIELSNTTFLSESEGTSKCK